MTGKTSRVNKKARKKVGQKESKVHCKEHAKQTDEVEANIVEDDGIVEKGKPSVAVVPPKLAEIAYCKQMGNPDPSALFSRSKPNPDL